MARETETRPRPARTFLEEIIHEVVEPIRGEILGEFGVRPYRVFLVTFAWSGGQEGRGTKGEKERTEIYCGKSGSCCRPTPPLVIFSGGWSRTLHGVVDEGEVRVEQIAGSLMEADLCNYARLEEGEESFYEIVQDGRDGESPDKPVGRYALIGKPIRHPEITPTSWLLRLRAQEPGETFGAPEEP